MRLYRDVLRVKEYFLFDACGDCLEPSLRGYRLRGGQYVQIRPVNGRLPSQVLGLHLERVGLERHFYDPVTGERVPTPEERHHQSEAKAEAAEAQAERERAAREAAEAEVVREREARLALEAEVVRERAARDADLIRERAARETLEARLEVLLRAQAQTPPQP